VSAVYLYAITDNRPARLPEEVDLLTVNGIVGVYGSKAEEELQATEANLWAHEAVVESLMEEGAVLPVRFGTVLQSLERLRDELMSRQEEFALALDRVRGRVELGVRAAWPQRVVVDMPAESGRGYLARKLEQQRAAADATSSVHDPLAVIAVDSTVRVLQTPCLTLVGSYLVDRGDVERFRAEAERLARALAGAQLACTGPWPPYSFTSQEERRER
jgi:gas vesicle protein GvpL/GvpF